MTRPFPATGTSRYPLALAGPRRRWLAQVAKARGTTVNAVIYTLIDAEMSKSKTRS